MFSDPLSVTYDGVSQSLARLGRTTRPGISRMTDTSVYGSADGEFQMFISEAEMSGSLRRFEISLERTEQDSDGPFTGNWSYLPNRFGLVYEINPFRYNTVTDVPLLRAALDNLVDATFQGRIIGGEK